jgi:hypothetical protein
MRLVLDLDEDQEEFLCFAVATAASAAWEASVAIDLEPCDHEDHEDCGVGARRDLAAAEAVLAQLPGGALRRWREMLSETGDDDGGDE